MALRLRRVPGLDGRANDVVFAPAQRPPAPAARPPSALLYFGGDVQDYPEAMRAHRDSRGYVRWNLESTARMLALAFPTRHILVVRPSRIEYKSFSCYDNFVPSNNAGVPDHTPTHSALQHLERLLQGVTSRLKSMPPAELVEAFSAPAPEDADIEDVHRAELSAAECAGAANGAAAGAGAGAAGCSAEAAERDEGAGAPWWVARLALERARLALVGFSKGCVVLNQLVYEFHYTHTLTPGDAHTLRLMERISEMWWLDGGHAGGKNTWITARSLLETLTRLDVKIYIHVSPYQVQDEGRPWIGREEKAFTSMLKKLGAKVQRHLHAAPAGASHSLHTHFAVLRDFKRLQDSAPAHSDGSDDDT